MTKFGTRTLIATLFVAFVAGPAAAQSYKAVCAAVAGVIGGKRYATVKCYKETEPGNYSIRSKVWEHQDAKGYRDMARFSGARFTCTMTVTGSRTEDDAVYDQLKVSDCRAGAPSRQAKPPAKKGSAPPQSAGPKQTSASGSAGSDRECILCPPHGGGKPSVLHCKQNSATWNSIGLNGTSGCIPK